MALGAIQPTEIIFGAKLEADANPEKLGKEARMPADNFLQTRVAAQALSHLYHLLPMPTAADFVSHKPRQVSAMGRWSSLRSSTPPTAMR